MRFSKPLSSRSRTSCATGASICRFIATSRSCPFSCVSQLRNGMYSVVTSMYRAPDFHQAPRQQTAQAETPDHLALVRGPEPILCSAELLPGLVSRHVLLDVRQRLERQIEGLRGR